RPVPPSCCQPGELVLPPAAHPAAGGDGAAGSPAAPARRPRALRGLCRVAGRPGVGVRAEGHLPAGGAAQPAARAPLALVAVSDLLVLCYHAVSERWPADLSVTPVSLREQLGSLVARGYRGLTFADAVLGPPDEP